MELLWTTSPRSLIEAPYIYNVFPTDDMTPVERANATARLSIIMTAATRVLWPDSKAWLIGTLAIMALFVYHSSRVDLQTDVQLAPTSRAVLDVAANKQVLDNKKQVETSKRDISTMVTNVREAAPPKQMVPTDEQRIYGTRSYVPQGTDTDVAEFADTAGPTKFVERLA